MQIPGLSHTSKSVTLLNPKKAELSRSRSTSLLHHGLVTSNNVIRAEPGLITTAEHDSLLEQTSNTLVLSVEPSSRGTSRQRHSSASFHKKPSRQGGISIHGVHWAQYLMTLFALSTVLHINSSPLHDPPHSWESRDGSRPNSVGVREGDKYKVVRFPWVFAENSTPVIRSVTFGCRQHVNFGFKERPQSDVRCPWKWNKKAGSAIRRLASMWCSGFQMRHQSCSHRP